MWVKDESEVSLPVKFVMDLERIEVGFISFASGAPDFRVAKIGETRPECPPDLGADGKPAFKPCFRVRICNKELGDSAKTVLRVMDDLHNQYEAQKSANTGLAPVVEIAGTEVVKINTPQGELRFKVPQWSITQWVERPAAMDGRQAEAAPTPPASEVVSAAVAATPPPAASAGGDLF